MHDTSVIYINLCTLVLRLDYMQQPLKYVFFFKLLRYTCNNGLTFYDTTLLKEILCLATNSSGVAEWETFDGECKGKIGRIPISHDLFDLEC